MLDPEDYGNFVISSMKHKNDFRALHPGKRWLLKDLIQSSCTPQIVLGLNLLLVKISCVICVAKPFLVRMQPD